MTRLSPGMSMALCAALCGGCNADGLSTLAAVDANQATAGDLAVPAPADDAAPDPGPVDPCSGAAPGGRSFGPPQAPFVLSSDPMPDPLEREVGLVRDDNGYLVMWLSRPRGGHLWVLNATDLAGAGTVSKLDSVAVRELARYPSVTCRSLKTGGTQACDGARGCCSIDDWARYQARKAHQQEPGHQAVSRVGNYPSRSDSDFNGDLFVANRADGLQSSVTKIANDPGECIDRNHNGRLDTSKDTSGDGFIDVDCNRDGQPDDLASVRARPCANGLPQEYYGDDDECVLWTANAFPAASTVLALALAAGANDSNASDAWVGARSSGALVKLDGNTGQAQQDAQLPEACFRQQVGLMGLAVDAQGIGWLPPHGAGTLCYFDTRNPQNVGTARAPLWGAAGGDGITIDRDQNVWVGNPLDRYTPDRSIGFKNLGTGWWTRIVGADQGAGVASDSRSANRYDVWSCQGGSSVLQVPASTIRPQKMDQQVAPQGWASVTMPCAGVAVDSVQDLWGVDSRTSTRAPVDRNGNITQPKVRGPAMGNNRCPHGDSCENAGSQELEPSAPSGRIALGSYPAPTYQVTLPGCRDAQGKPAATAWGTLSWDAEVPPNTTLEVQARSGPATDLADPRWQASEWTMPFSQSPQCLQGGVLVPNVAPTGPATAADGALTIEFIFRTQSQLATPRLKSFQVTWTCP